ncbi:DMRT3 factor, partial [Pseudoatta argentina]
MGKVKKRRSSVEIPRTETGRKKPMCGRCEVHGVIVLLEGHKMYCKFQKCTCDDCYNFLMQQRIAADNIARKRANKLSKEKKISHVEVNGLSELVIYTLEEMYKSFTVWRSPTKIERILRILVKYAREIDSRIKFNGFLEYFKDSIFKVIYGAEPMSFMTFQQATCYIPPTQILHAPNKELVWDQAVLDGTKLQYPLLNLEYPSQNFPVSWSSNVSLMTTNMSLETFKSPSELSVKSFYPLIDFSAGPSTDSLTAPLREFPTDLSTKSSTYCW